MYRQNSAVELSQMNTHVPLPHTVRAIVRVVGKASSGEASGAGTTGQAGEEGGKGAGGADRG